MDIQMPVMDSLEVTRTLRREGIKMPIIALTAQSIKGDDQKCSEAGCNSYLYKPLDRFRLIEKVRQPLSATGDQDKTSGNSFKLALSRFMTRCNDCL
jgi:CheY-like chemotaxis protein